MTPAEFEIPSLQWFDHEVRVAVLRVLGAGTLLDGWTWYIGGTLPEELDKVVANPNRRLRDIVNSLALFGYGVVWRSHIGCTPLVAEYFERELAAAEAEHPNVLHWVDSEPPQPRFDASVCAISLRLLGAGADPDAMSRWLDEAMAQSQPQLREIAHALVFFNHCALWSYFGHSAPAVHKFLARELGNAEEIQAFADDARRGLHELTNEPPAALGGSSWA